MKVLVCQPLIKGIGLPVLADHLKAQDIPEFLEEGGVFIDAAGGVITPEVSGHGIENDGERHRARRKIDDGIGNLFEAMFSFIGEDDHPGPVGLEDGDILDDIAEDGFRAPRSAYDDERLRGKIDVLFVFNDIRRYGLVAQFTQFDPDFIGGDLVRPAAHDGPVLFSPGDVPGGLFYLRRFFQYPAHEAGRLFEGFEFALDHIVAETQHLADAESQDMTGHNLGVEGLGGGDGHLDVPAVARVEDPVGPVGDVRLPAVHDGDDKRPAFRRHGDRPVGIRGCPRLGDGDDQCIAQVVRQRESAEFRSLLGFHGKMLSLQIAGETVGDGRPRHGSRPVTDDDNMPDLLPGQVSPQPRRKNVFSEIERDFPVL